jgi:hypothetical protein
MFLRSVKRFRALMTLVDDVLGDPEPPAVPHPHRRAVRIDLRRRAGSVPPRPAHCLSPVRPSRESPGRDRIGT